MSSSFRLATTILPQLKQNNHGVDVVDMFFFDDNANILRKGNEIDERLNKKAKESGILTMECDQCALGRYLADGKFKECRTGNIISKNMIEVDMVGYFPQLYSALSTNLPNLVITL